MLGSTLVAAAFLDPGAWRSASAWWWRGQWLAQLIGDEPRWALPIATLVVLPLWFVWWRRTAVSFGRVAGVALSLIVGFAMWIFMLTDDSIRWSQFVVISLTWAVAAFVRAFSIAPDPRDPEAIGDLTQRVLLRRHRKSHGDA